MKKINAKYDASVKEWYLKLVKDQSPVTTYNTTKTYINSINEWENRFEKSLTDFTLQEVKTMLRGFRFTSEASYYTVLSILTKYTDFACSRLSKPICQIRLIDAGDAEDIINNMAVENKYITRDELFEVFRSNQGIHDRYKGEEGDDSVGKLLMCLLFEGIRGRDYQDIIKLKIQDIDFENKRIYISSLDSYVEIQDSRSWSLIERVSTEKYLLHFKKDGIAEKVSILDGGDLLFKRLVASKGKPPKPENMSDYYSIKEFSSHAIKMRARAVLDELNLPYLTGTSVYVSGVAERADKWLRDEGKDMNYGQVRRYLNISKEKIGVSGLVSALEHLYAE